jgi:hypothetical protein
VARDQRQNKKGGNTESYFEPSIVVHFQRAFSKSSAKPKSRCDQTNLLWA